MKKIYSSLLFLLIPMLIFCQSTSERAVTVFESHQLNQIGVKLLNGEHFHNGACLAEIPLDHIDPFLAYSIVWYADNWSAQNTMKAYFHDGTSQTNPVNILQEGHATPRDGQYISQLYFTDKNAKKIRLQFSGKDEIKQIEVHFFNPGKTENPAPAIIDDGHRLACPCPQPDYLSRSGWCPDGTCPENPNPAITNVTHLIVHHSAGSNFSSDWAATVRSIYDFHVFTNGWDDIGYNWLIDPNGVIYQGRGDNVRGAHFCGNNSGTMGVCMMGTYTDVLPTTFAFGSLEHLLAWKSCDIGAEPDGEGFHASSGLNLMHISGHRDGCATECPGNTLYPTLPQVRQNVKSIIEDECEGIELAAPTNLDAFLGPNDEILITWEDNADNEESYEIQRSFMTTGNFAIVANVPADTEEFENTANINFSYYFRVRAKLGNAYSSFSNVAFYSPPLNDYSLLNKNTVSIFPNPANNFSNIEIKNEFIGTAHLSIYNILGQQLIPEQIIQKNNFTLNTNIDLSPFNAGIYLIKIEMGDEEKLYQIAKM